ncbi:MAG: Ni/Fe hydrogenase subunit alpha [Vicinamibacterales bacterium]
MSRITIDPITRLEGHGKIEIFLDAQGNVEKAFFQVPELRGFEKFAIGRPAEDMPQITSRICGVCPTAHHMAATKALDALYSVQPPDAAIRIRDLVYNTFMVEDHALHIYYLGGPDFIVGPQAPPAERNILGVIARVGLETAGRVIATRRRLRNLISRIGGKVTHPVLGLPGGVAKRMSTEDLAEAKAAAAEAVEFARFTLDVFDQVVLKNSGYVDLILSDTFTHRTHAMGMVDSTNCPNFYDGEVRVVDSTGMERARFKAAKYLDFVAEHVEPWSYVKFAYFKPAGWRGFVEGPDTGVYSVAPLARLNVADRMATPIAQEAYERYVQTLGGKPVHHTLANHWARVIELIFAAERMKQLAEDPVLADPNVRTLPTAVPREGVGIVEAPRGTLIHHYQTDERGLITMANLIVATAHNSARMAMGIEKAAKGLIHGGNVPEGVLNMVEMAFRAYDPCHGCATHSLPGSMPLVLRVLGPGGEPRTTLRRGGDGVVRRTGC